jgi:hypothetical protein
VRYFGELDIDSITEWITRKIAISNNIIPEYNYFVNKVKKNKMLVVFVAQRNTCHNEFRAFMKCGHMLMHMQDVEFAFLYPEDFKQGIGNLESLI